MLPARRARGPITPTHVKHEYETADGVGQRSPCDCAHLSQSPENINEIADQVGWLLLTTRAPQGSGSNESSTKIGLAPHVPPGALCVLVHYERTTGFQEFRV